MPKHFYLSTRKDRLDQAAPLLDALKANGWKQTFAWSDQDAHNPREYADIAQAELSGVREADVLIVLLPGGFGTHVEIGAALALGKRIILHAPDRKTLETPYACVFHYHPLVTLLVAGRVDVNTVLASLPKPKSSV
jgi:nucleoside 2-deoxyribosyltransferase